MVGRTNPVGTPARAEIGLRSRVRHVYRRQVKANGKVEIETAAEAEELS